MFQLRADGIISQCRASIQTWQTHNKGIVDIHEEPILYNYWQANAIDQLWYIKTDYDYLKGAPPSPRVLVTAGFHGNEIAGPLTFAFHMYELLSFAQRYRVNLFILPLCNPTGWNRNERYSWDKGKFGNNDFVRYHLKAGQKVGDLTGFENNRTYTQLWPAFYACSVPGETNVVQRVLWNQISNGTKFEAAIDLHQDHETLPNSSGAYHYAFGDLSRYRNITKSIRRFIPVMSGISVAAGQSSPMTTDENGFLVRHDGSITDLMHRLGVPHTVCVETTAATPLELAVRVNLVWVKGIIQLVSKGK